MTPFSLRNFDSYEYTDEGMLLYSSRIWEIEKTDNAVFEYLNTWIEQILIGSAEQVKIGYKGGSLAIARRKKFSSSYLPKNPDWQWSHAALEFLLKIDHELSNEQMEELLADEDAFRRYIAKSQEIRDLYNTKNVDLREGLAYVLDQYDFSGWISVNAMIDRVPDEQNGFPLLNRTQREFLKKSIWLKCYVLDPLRDPFFESDVVDPEYVNQMINPHLELDVSQLPGGLRRTIAELEVFNAKGDWIWYDSYLECLESWSKQALINKQITEEQFNVILEKYCGLLPD